MVVLLGVSLIRIRIYQVSESSGVAWCVTIGNIIYQVFESSGVAWCFTILSRIYQVSESIDVQLGVSL